MRYLFLLLVFILTFHGLFKSDLESCSDYNFKISNFYPSKEYKYVEKSNIEKKSDLQKYDIEKKKYENEKIEEAKKPVCVDPEIPLTNPNCRYKVRDEKLIQRFFDATYGHLLSDKKQVVSKEYSEREIDNKYGQFLRKNLKEKMTNYIYENLYRKCADMKKNEPEIFKAKYE